MASEGYLAMFQRQRKGWMNPPEEYARDTFPGSVNAYLLTSNVD